ncbi:MAG: hypothetical protein OQK46_03625 [Gammaproteobacteria bacterium]|nr:hypothetical protein [Gammaproteobacteria bacterium]
MYQAVIDDVISRDMFAKASNLPTSALKNKRNALLFISWCVSASKSCRKGLRYESTISGILSNK